MGVKYVQLFIFIVQVISSIAIDAPFDAYVSRHTLINTPPLVRHTLFNQAAAGPGKGRSAPRKQLLTGSATNRLTVAARRSRHSRRRIPATLSATSRSHPPPREGSQFFMVAADADNTLLGHYRNAMFTPSLQPFPTAHPPPPGTAPHTACSPTAGIASTVADRRPSENQLAASPRPIRPAALARALSG